MRSFDFLRPALLAAGLSVALGAQAESVEAPDTAKVAEQVQWKIWGGEASFRWNRDLMSDLGIEVSSAIGGSKADAYGQEVLSISDVSALDFSGKHGNFAGFTGGSLIVRGGFDLHIGKEHLALRDIRLVPRKDDGFVLDVVAGDGTAWFYIDRMMYVVEVEGAPALSIRTMDMRVAPALAKRLGQPKAEGLAVADLAMHTHIHSNGGDPAIFRPKGTTTKWPGDPVPGVPGAVYEADVFMHHFDVQYSRSSGMTGPSGTGKIVFTPSSTLRNNRNNGTAQPTFPSLSATGGGTGSFPASDPLGTSDALHAANVVWNDRKLNAASGGPATAPYGNDQHPYLIWNLYRIDADGRINQIGRSGVKHAFLTTNSPCDSYPGTGYILGRGCVDTYGTSNNDWVPDLGPRSEIVPATGIWGRCGSVFDANCDGLIDQNQPCVNAPGIANCNTWAYRLQTDERDISSSVNPGATYWFESWYIVRDDINIFNTMQTRPVMLNWSGSTWFVDNGPRAGLMLGPAVDRWLARGTDNVTERSTDIETEHGHARLAMKATALPGGGWRYDYVVANFDYAVADIQYDGGDVGNPRKLRVLSNTGFTSFEVDAVGTPVLDADQFSDGDREAGNDWAFSQAGSTVRWTPPGGDVGAATANALNWGTMFRFSFESDAAPVAGVARLNAPDGVMLEVPTLVPQGEEEPVLPLFEDGFEGDAPGA